MRNRWKMWGGAGVLTLALLATSCGSKVKGLQQDPTFTYHRMEHQRAAIGGVAYPYPANGGSFMSREEMADLLALEFVRNRDDLNLLPQGYPMRRLGEVEYYTMLDEFERGGILMPDQLDALQQAMYPELRYLVFGRIEQDQISRGSREKTKETDDGVQEILELTTTRYVTVAFNIYDLQQERSVWRGHLSRRATNKNRYAYDVNEVESEQDVIELIVGVIAAEVGEKPRHPAAPPMEALLSPIFGKFAKSLPTRDEVITAKK